MVYVSSPATFLRSVFWRYLCIGKLFLVIHGRSTPPGLEVGADHGKKEFRRRIDVSHVLLFCFFAIFLSDVIPLHGAQFLYSREVSRCDTRPAFSPRAKVRRRCGRYASA